MLASRARRAAPSRVERLGRVAAIIDDVTASRFSTPSAARPAHRPERAHLATRTSCSARRGARVPRRARSGRLPGAARAAVRSRAAQPREPADLRAGPPHRHRRPGERPLQRHQPLAAHRHRVRRQLGRQLGQRLPPPRLRLPGASAAPSTRPATCRIGSTACEWHDAAGIWGLDVPASLARLRELHPESEAAVIGPAGERGVLFA